MRNQHIGQSGLILLALLIAAFILKGLVFTSIIPMHQGSDEYIHYATVQYLAEPKEKAWERSKEPRMEEDTKYIDEYHYTEEIRAFARLTESRNLAGKPQNTQDFNPSEISRVEAEMKSDKYPPHIAFTEPTLVGGGRLAHQIGAKVERIFSNQDAFTRYAIIRLLAVFYGVIAIVCAYYIAFWSGFRRNHALLIAGIVAFQPQFTATTAIINYDPLLIAAYSATLLAAVSVLRHGLTAWNILALFACTWIAFAAKTIGGVLIGIDAGVILWGLGARFFTAKKKIKVWQGALVALALVGLVFFAISQESSLITNIPETNKDGSETLVQSLADYWKDHVINPGRIERTALTYWGAFGWFDAQIHESTLSGIQTIEKISVAGLLLLLAYWVLRSIALFFWWIIRKIFSIQSAPQKQSVPARYVRVLVRTIDKFFHKDFLPNWKYLLLFAISILLLQIAIRFYDWHGHYMGGEGVGTPGRYFLPNIIPHIILVLVGFGAFAWSSRIFGIILKVLFSAMVLLCLYSIFWVIIPRYYL